VTFLEQQARFDNSTEIFNNERPPQNHRGHQLRAHLFGPPKINKFSARLVAMRRVYQLLRQELQSNETVHHVSKEVDGHSGRGIGFCPSVPQCRIPDSESKVLQPVLREIPNSLQSSVIASSG
jgi:hypothetical protein